MRDEREEMSPVRWAGLSVRLWPQKEFAFCSDVVGNHHKITPKLYGDKLPGVVKVETLEAERLCSNPGKRRGKIRPEFSTAMDRSD